jgi:hypothetical protein
MPLTRREFEQLSKALRMSSAMAAQRVDDSGYAVEQPESMVNTEKAIELLTLYTVPEDSDSNKGVK